MPSLNENDCLIVILARHSVSLDILCIYKKCSAYKLFLCFWYTYYFAYKGE